MPAATAAATPSGLSSTTRQSTGFDAHRGGRVQEEIRGGLAVRDVLGAEDPALEPVQKPTAVNAVRIRRWVPDEARQYVMPRASS